MRPQSRLTGRQSKKFVERRTVRSVYRAILVALLLAAVIFLLSSLSRLSVLTITGVNVIGADPDLTASLQASVFDAIKGNYVGLFPKANSILFSKSDVENAVKNASPRIDAVKTTRSGLTGLNITVTEKTPSALVCLNFPDFSGTTLSLSSDDDCYFADKDGLIFEKAPSFTGHIYNRYYIPSLADSGSSTDAILGTYATSTMEFTSLQVFYNGINNAHINADAILMKENGEYELYANNTDNDTVVIYFNDARPFSEELVNLVSFWNKMADEAKQARTTARFEYIDVRYGSNVFYRKL